MKPTSSQIKANKEFVEFLKTNPEKAYCCMRVDNQSCFCALGWAIFRADPNVRMPNALLNVPTRQLLSDFYGWGHIFQRKIMSLSDSHKGWEHVSLAIEDFINEKEGTL